jgi:hypothetical protein
MVPRSRFTVDGPHPLNGQWQMTNDHRFTGPRHAWQFSCVSCAFCGNDVRILFMSFVSFMVKFSFFSP